MCVIPVETIPVVKGVGPHLALYIPNVRNPKHTEDSSLPESRISFISPTCLCLSEIDTVSGVLLSNRLDMNSLQVFNIQHSIENKTPS